MEIDQETIIQIQMMEHETNHLNEQLQIIEHNNREMSNLIDSINEISKKETKEIMIDLGKRIFIPVDIKDKKLIVDVGKGNFVKKSTEDTKKSIEEEKNKLIENKNAILKRLNELQEDMQKIINEIESKN